MFLMNTNLGGHYLNYNTAEGVLAGVAQWIECRPADQRVTSSVLSQGTCLGGSPGPLLGAWERPPIYVSLPLSFSLSFFFPLSKTN